MQMGIKPVRMQMGKILQLGAQGWHMQNKHTL